MRHTLLLATLLLANTACHGHTPPVCSELDRIDVPMVWEDSFEPFSVADVVPFGESIWLVAVANDSDAKGIRSWYARYDCAAPGPLVWRATVADPTTRSYVHLSPNADHLLMTRAEGAGHERVVHHQVLGLDGSPIGGEHQLIVPTLNGGPGAWTPWGEGWVASDVVPLAQPEYAVYSTLGAADDIEELARFPVAPDTFVLSSSFAGPHDDLHLVWADSTPDDTGIIRAGSITTGQAFDVAAVGYYDDVDGILGAPWMTLIALVDDDPRTELLGLDGTRVPLHDEIVQYVSGDGGYWGRSDTAVYWLPEDAMEPQQIAEVPDHYPSVIVSLEGGRAAVSWTPMPGSGDPAAMNPHVQVYMHEP